MIIYMVLRYVMVLQSLKKDLSSFDEENCEKLIRK